ncbi:polysaccharide pyruvyl transferase family protein [Agromyces sp. Leaf222]|uniref:polysaccharide pyruvyl transferase family protein n=1 Tax=Agromyces sp. Leaf222 TaxID=1735688 RepID=UPI0009E82E79|nr:polysaccharide pyruvyl transferase family protein [Agromyces sp. Leaf222]
MGRVLVRTLPLHGNYGNILQAWALQQSLTRLGLSTFVDVSISTEKGRRRWPYAKDLVKRALLTLGVSHPYWIRYVRGGVDAALQDFVARRIDVARLYVAPGKCDLKLLEHVDAFLVGSDQVWRRPYGDVGSYLLNFLTDDDRRPKIAYAASFGRNDLEEYSPALLADSRRLAQRFDAVSVRESSGVRLADEYWDVRALQHVDPTLLIEPAEYLAISKEASDTFPTGRLVDYVLDDEVETRRLVAQIATALDEVPISLMPPPPPTSYREFRRNSERYRKPSIGAWIGAISGARFVVTDSFHGTVFSIIHNVPFVAVANRDRGAARFESLLETFGLRSRLVYPGESAPLAEVTTDIDWEYVNSRIAAEQRRSFAYLRRTLNQINNTAAEPAHQS